MDLTCAIWYKFLLLNTYQQFIACRCKWNANLNIPCKNGFLEFLTINSLRFCQEVTFLMVLFQVPIQIIPLGVPKRGSHPHRGGSKLWWRVSGPSFLRDESQAFDISPLHSTAPTLNLINQPIIYQSDLKAVCKPTPDNSIKITSDVTGNLHILWVLFISS